MGKKCQVKRKTRQTICCYRHLPLSIFSCRTEALGKKAQDKGGKTFRLFKCQELGQTAKKELI